MKKTVNGIRLDINPGVFTDILTVEMLSDVSAPMRDDLPDIERREEEAKRTKAVMALSRRILGDRFDAVYAQLAERGGGYVSADEWAQFLTSTIEAYQKNTDARPAPGGK